MTSYEFIERAKLAICEYANDKWDHLEPKPVFQIEDVHTVWQCKTLQNHKGVFCTFEVRPLLYEVTYNGDKNEMYLDVYEKEHNRKIVIE